ncbi:MAG: GlsB/YeaQ/YmgE family stress response membrane protein [Polyangiaceae bacterium]
MSLLLFLFFGLFVGLLARAIMPGKQSMGFVMTALLGVAGAFVGGFLTSLFTDQRVLDLHAAGLIGSVVGALVLLFVARALAGGGRNALA